MRLEGWEVGRYFPNSHNNGYVQGPIRQFPKRPLTATNRGVLFAAERRAGWNWRRRGNSAQSQVLNAQCSAPGIRARMVSEYCALDTEN